MSYKEIQKMYKTYALWNTKFGGAYKISIPRYKGTNTNIPSHIQTYEVWTNLPKNTSK